MLKLIIILLLFITSILLGFVCIAAVIFAFVDDSQTFLYIFRNSYELAFKQTEQDKAIKSTTDYLNYYLRNAAQQVVSSKDSELQAQLHLSKAKAHLFKQTMTDILKTDCLFFTKDAVRDASKRYKSFHFTNLVIANTQLYANDKAILIKQLNDTHRQGLLSNEEYYAEMLGTKNLSMKQAKAKLIASRHQIQHHQFNVLPFAFEMVHYHTNKIKMIYDMSREAQLI